MDPVTASALISAGGSILGSIFGGGDTKTETVVNYSKHRKSLEKAGYSPLANLNVNGAGTTTSSGPSAAVLASQAIVSGADQLGAVFENAQKGDKAEKQDLANSVGVINQEAKGSIWRQPNVSAGAVRETPAGSAGPLRPIGANMTVLPARTTGGPSQLNYGLPAVDVFGTGHTGMAQDPEMMPVGVDAIRTVDDSGNTSYQGVATTVRANDGTQVTHTGLPIAAVEETFGEGPAAVESIYQTPDYIRQRDPQIWSAIHGWTQRSPFAGLYKQWRDPNATPVIDWITPQADPADENFQAWTGPEYPENPTIDY